MKSTKYILYPQNLWDIYVDHIDHIDYRLIYEKYIAINLY
jgi:hypothetical protein